MRRSVLVTGSGGFVGRAAIKILSDTGYVVRQASHLARPGASQVGPLSAETDWRPIVEDRQVVLHLAARVHIGGRGTAEDFDTFRTTNRDGTLRLAEQAAWAGVRRFVFMSTIKVNGEGAEQPYSESDTPAPQGAYAVSKYEAEEGLKEIAARTGLEVVILRPPLVYGPGVKGNFRALVKLVARGVPLPLASVRNQRSFIGLANLVSAIQLALEHPAAAGRTYPLSDQHDLSTPELVEKLATALGRRSRLFPFPVPALELASRLIGRHQAFQQLAGSLAVDSSAISRELGWRPVRTVDEELADTAAWFRGQ